MSLILSGTDGLSDVDGSAATPAIRGTDANTGIFFGTDIIGFSEGGVEAARFNADSQFVAAAGTAALPVITTTGDVNTGIFFPAADVVGVSTGGSERVRVDASGNVGIGTTSLDILDQVGANRPLVVKRSDSNTTINGSTASISIVNGDTTTSNTAQLNFAAITGANTSGYSSAVISCIFGARTNGQYPTGVLTFSTSTTLNSAPLEKMRLTSAGDLLVGRTSLVGTERLSMEVDGSKQGQIIRSTNTSGNPQIFRIATGQASGAIGTGRFITCDDGGTDKFIVAGSGNVTNTNNSYGAISDVKLKENIVDTTPKLADLMQVKVRNYNLIGSTTKQIGVVAQELEIVFPAMIDESPDRDEEGNELSTKTKAVKYSVFVPILIKAIQEQQALIQSLTDRITALETP
jgi:hypothetical protein